MCVPSGLAHLCQSLETECPLEGLVPLRGRAWQEALNEEGVSSQEIVGPSPFLWYLLLLSYLHKRGFPSPRAPTMIDLTIGLK